MLKKLKYIAKRIKIYCSKYEKYCSKYEKYCSKNEMLKKLNFNAQCKKNNAKKKNRPF